MQTVGTANFFAAKTLSVGIEQTISTTAKKLLNFSLSFSLKSLRFNVLYLDYNDFYIQPVLECDLIWKRKEFMYTL